MKDGHHQLLRQKGGQKIVAMNHAAAMDVALTRLSRSRFRRPGRTPRGRRADRAGDRQRRAGRLRQGYPHAHGPPARLRCRFLSFIDMPGRHLGQGTAAYEKRGIAVDVPPCGRPRAASSATAAPRVPPRGHPPGHPEPEEAKAGEGRSLMDAKGRQAPPA